MTAFSESSGMTGIAAGLCRTKKAVEDISYTVTSKGDILDSAGQLFLDARPSCWHFECKPVTGLQPPSTYNNVFPPSPEAFEAFASRTLTRLIPDCEWMYRTVEPKSQRPGEILSVIWSDVFLCNGCGKEIVFWNAAIDQ